MLHLEEETRILKTSSFAPFVELFPNYQLQISVQKLSKTSSVFYFLVGKLIVV